jgi:hypothetical protein
MKFSKIETIMLTVTLLGLLGSSMATSVHASLLESLAAAEPSKHTVENFNVAAADTDGLSNHRNEDSDELIVEEQLDDELFGDKKSSVSSRKEELIMRIRELLMGLSAPSAFHKSAEKRDNLKRPFNPQTRLTICF